MKRAVVAVLSVLPALASCAVGPSYRTPRPDVPAGFAAAAPPASAPPASAPAGTAASAVDTASWWRALGDPQLDSLIERAVKSNLDIESALLRLQQARTYEAVVAGHALPEVEASAAEGRGTGSDLSRGRAAQALHSADNTAGLSHLNTLAGFDAVWQLDVFGKYRRALQAARFDTQAAAQARYGVITAVIADVARAYVDLRAEQLLLGVLRQASDLARESLRIVDIRYQRGITNELDVALATRELDAIQAQVAPAEAQVKASEYAIAVLLGAYPESVAQELDTPALIPSLPGGVAPGVPLDLLKRRPDIGQAERELAASTARIGVSAADLFPQVALVGSIGAQRGMLAANAQTVGQHVWSFGPAAAWPLLDFGALDAQVDIADLEAQRSLIAYRQTILNAVEEVDAALDGYAAEQSRLQQLSGAVLAGERAVEVATERYNRGLTDFLNVVDAQRQLYDIQGEYVVAQRTQAEQFVRLYRSLGGGWEHFEKVPKIRQPQPAVLAAFRRLLTGWTETPVAPAAAPEAAP